MCKWTYIFIIICLPFVVASQSLSSKGRFSVDYNRGCAPLTVTIRSLDSFGDVTRLYSYIDPEVFTNDTTFIYDSVGTYEIVQVVGQDGIGDKTDTLIIEVVEPRMPEVEITRCNDFQLTVTSVDTFYDSVRLYFTPVDSVTLQAGESTQFSYMNDEPQTIDLEGLFDNADETCAQYFMEVNPLQALITPVLATASIKETCRDNYTLYLTLDAIQEAVTYQVVLTQNGNNSVVYQGFLDSTFLQVSNIPFTLNDYCISVELLDVCQNTSNSSNEICLSPTALSLSPFENLYSTYEGSSIFVNLDQVTEGSFEIERRLLTGSFAQRAVQTGSFTDPTGGSSSRPYVYRISYRNVCGEILYQAETNPPLVVATEISDNRYEINLVDANNSLGTPEGVTYQVGNGTSGVQPFETNPQFINLDPNDGIDLQPFFIQAAYPDGSTLRSNTVELNYELIVHVPKAFTPNGDGLNDTLEFFGVPSEKSQRKYLFKMGSDHLFFY